MPPDHESDFDVAAGRARVAAERVELDAVARTLGGLDGGPSHRRLKKRGELGTTEARDLQERSDRRIRV